MLLYLILITLILLCWGNGYYIWGQPNYQPVGGILGLMGLVLLIILILLLLGVMPSNFGPAPVTTYPTR